MKIKKGDKVIVIAGKDKGISGKVLRALPSLNKVVVEGANIVKKHQKSRKSGESGQIVDKTLPIHISNVALTDPEGGKPTKIGIKRENGKRVRFARKSGITIK